MAIYKFNSKVGHVGSAERHVKYILRKGSQKNDLVYQQSGNMETIEGVETELDFWRAADENERANGVTHREYLLIIPNELSIGEGVELVEKFHKKEIDKKFPYTMVIHNTVNHKKERNLHCHLVFSERQIDGIKRDTKLFFKQAYTKNPSIGGAKKDRELRLREKLFKLRKSWEDEVNKALEEAEIDDRVSSESLKTQREKALEKGELDKAELLDRQAIDLPLYLFHKIARVGFEGLYDKEKEKVRKFEETKKLKNK